MKTKNFAKKLNLNRRTIANLDRKQLRAVRGGEDSVDVCLDTQNTNCTCITETLYTCPVLTTNCVTVVTCPVTVDFTCSC
jgi:natural product precursor